MMGHVLKISSRLEELAVLSAWLNDWLPKTLSDSMQNSIALVLQELVTNAIIHGNKKIESKSVSITLSIDDKALLFEIEDEGEGWPTLPTKEEAQNMNYLEENGRGLKLAVLLSHVASTLNNKICITFKI